MTQSIFEIMRDWVSFMLGDTVANSARGLIFCDYASFIMVSVIIIGTFKVLKYFINLLSWR